MKHKVRLTVIDKKLFPELQHQYCADPSSGVCPCYNVRDLFEFYREGERDDFWHCGLNSLVHTHVHPDTVAGGPRMPHRSELWDAISRYIYTGLQGGSIIIPINFLYADGHIYFHCALEGHKMDAVKASDKVCFTVIDQPVQEPGATNGRTPHADHPTYTPLVRAETAARRIPRRPVCGYGRRSRESREESKLACFSEMDGVKDDKLLLNAPRGNYDLKVQLSAKPTAYHGGHVPIGKSVGGVVVRDHASHIQDNLRRILRRVAGASGADKEKILQH